MTPEQVQEIERKAAEASAQLEEVQRKAQEAEARAADLESKLQEVQRKADEQAELVEIERSVADVAEKLPSIPNGADLGRALHVLRKQDSKTYEVIRAALDGCEALIAKSVQMAEVGSNVQRSAGGNDEARAAFSARVNAIKVERGIRYDEALRAAQQENPELYSAARAGETGEK